MRFSTKLAAFILVAMLTPASMAYAWGKAEKMSALQLQQIQSKEFEADKNTVFSSVMSVLQDSGYRIGAADKDTGLITGVASTKSKLTWMPFVGFGSGKKTPVVSAFIEDIGPTFTKVRLSFVMSKMKSNQFGSGEDEDPILDPSVYTDAFEKISQAIFIRQAMAAKAQPAATVAPTTPVAADPAAAPAAPAAATAAPAATSPATPK